MPTVPPSRFFPPAEEAGPEGIVGFGGQLDPEWLLDAYQHGIFPWPTGEPGEKIPGVRPIPGRSSSRTAFTCRGDWCGPAATGDSPRPRMKISPA